MITGGSAGIGLALAKRLVADGVEVTICGRDRGRLAEVEGVRTVVADLSTEAGARALAAETPDRVDLLFNNAAIQLLNNWTTQQSDDLLADIATEVGVNLLGPMRLTALLLPKLSPDAVIVNVTSGLGLVPKRSAPGYCASKAGLSAFSTAMRYQLAPRRVVEVMLPLVDTAMTAGRGAGKITADAAANAILSGLGRDVVRVGAVRKLVTLHRLAPRLAAKVMRDQ
ncbi:SDR family NAD(P)-dependent oxidoreductase [Actinokineospora sp. HUAS TT18]|uniref:SDR family NAD(P)-dependent oxidoreductase n=1 Tax=Actinokineospora sp. HUAS TT18 TaxID=3447451 RepID=UPI003F51F36B